MKWLSIHAERSRATAAQAPSPSTFLSVLRLLHPACFSSRTPGLDGVRRLHDCESLAIDRARHPEPVVSV